MPKMVRDRVSPFARAQLDGLVAGEAALAAAAAAVASDEQSAIPATTIRSEAEVFRTRRPPLAWMPLFLKEIAEGASVKDAGDAAGIGSRALYSRRKTDPDFRREWCEAAEVGTRLLEQEAQRRAYHGTLKPVFFKGEQCGTIREYSDTLMMFLLKARKPDEYRDRKGDDSAKPTAVNITVVNVDSLPPAERSAVVGVSPEAVGTYRLATPSQSQSGSVGVSVIQSEPEACGE